jgi:hypothetical protein
VTSPTAYPGRPAAPAPGAPAPERRVARVRAHARRLFWSALVLIAVAGATGYFTGNLPEPLQDWMLWAAAGLVVALLVVIPYVRWWTHTYTVTTRRVVEQSGVFGRRRRGAARPRLHHRGASRSAAAAVGRRHARAVQRCRRAAAYGERPRGRLLHEALSDQVEVSQILAHRDGHWDGATAPLIGDPPPLPR